jgi:hypothetical protein
LKSSSRSSTSGGKTKEKDVFTAVGKKATKEFTAAMQALAPLSIALPPLSSETSKKQLKTPKSFNYAKNGFSNQLEEKILRTQLEKKLKKIVQTTVRHVFGELNK